MKYIANMQDQKKIIKELYLSATDEIANAVTSDETMNVLDEIARKNSLNAADRATLEKVVTDVILGIKSKESMLNELKSNIKNTNINAQLIKNDIDSRIISIIPKDKLNEQRRRAEMAMTGKEGILHSTPEIKKVETTLAPTVIAEKQNDLPMIVNKPKTALTFEERKKLVPNIPSNTVHYEGGKDPYREPI